LNDIDVKEYSIKAKKSRKALFVAVFLCGLMIMSNFAVLMAALNPEAGDSSTTATSPVNSIAGNGAGINIPLSATNPSSKMKPSVITPKSGSDLNIAGSSVIKNIIAKLGDLRVSGNLSIIDSIIELRNIYLAENSSLFVDPTTLIVNGNIYVGAGATVTYDNTIIKMNCTSDGQYRIQVNATGRLILKNYSAVKNGTTDHNYLFMIYGRLDVWNSNISRVGMPMDAPFVDMKGLYVGNNGIAEFNYSHINYSKVGVIADSGARVTVKNSTIDNCAVGILAYQDSAKVIIENNDISNNGQTDKVMIPTKVSNIFSDNFESGTGQWTMNSQTLPPTYFNDVESGAGGFMVSVDYGGSLWHTTTLWSNSSSNSWWAGQELTSDYNYGPSQRSSVKLIGPAINTTGLQDAHLRYYEAFQTEGLRLGNATIYDQCHVGITLDSGTTITNISWRNPTGGSNPSWPFFDMVDLDISAYTSTQFRFVFWFDTMDGLNNTFWGWFVDDFRVYDANPRLWTTTTAQSHSPTHSLTDSPNTNYAKGEDVYAQTASYVDLSDPSVGAAFLQYYSLYRTQAVSDYFTVEASNNYGISWTVLSNHSGASAGWPTTFQMEQLDLSSYLGSDHLLLRFRMTANMDNVIYDGVYIDDVTVSVTKSLAVSGGIVAYMSSNVIVDGNLISGNGDPSGIFTFVPIPNLVPLLVDNVEGGPFWWTTTPLIGPDLWHITSTASSSPTQSWWFGQELTGDYNAGNLYDLLSSPIIDATGFPNLKFTFNERYWTEDLNFYDRCTVEVTPDAGFTWIPVYLSHPLTGSASPNQNPEWPGFRSVVIDITPYATTTFGVRFAFQTVDGAVNAYPGWFLDDIGFAVDVTIPAHVFGGILSLDYSTVKMTDNDVISNYGYGVYANTTATAEWTVVNGGSAVSNDINLNGNVTVLSGQLTFDDVHASVWNVTISQPGSMQLINSPTTVISSDVLNYGSLYVNASTWLMNCTYDGEFSIDNYGYMYVDSSTIDRFAASNFLFRVWSNGSFEYTNSALHHCGMASANLDELGLFIATDNALIHNGCDISSNYYGIFVMSSSPTIVDSSISFNSVYGIYWLNNTINAMLSGLTVNSNGWTGILLNGFDVLLNIQSSDVNSNSWNGIDVVAWNTANITIGSCNANGNGNYGVHSAWAADTLFSMVNDAVDSNSNNGVDISSWNINADIQTSSMQSNLGSGMVLQATGGTLTVSMASDTCSGNFANGASLSGNALVNATISGSSFSSNVNGAGLLITSPSGDVIANLISIVANSNPSSDGVRILAAGNLDLTTSGNSYNGNGNIGISAVVGNAATLSINGDIANGNVAGSGFSISATNDISGSVISCTANANGGNGISLVSTGGNIAIEAWSNIAFFEVNGLYMQAALTVSGNISSNLVILNSNDGIEVIGGSVSANVRNNLAFVNFRNGITVISTTGDILIDASGNNVGDVINPGNFLNGIYIWSANNATVFMDSVYADMNFNCGIFVEAVNQVDVTIWNTQASWNGGFGPNNNGILIRGNDVIADIEACSASSNLDAGIYLFATNDIVNAILIGNTCNGNFLQGIKLVANNDISATVYSNTCDSNSHAGIAFSAGWDMELDIQGNHATSNLNNGIYLSGSTIGAYLAGNNASLNMMNGIHVSCTYLDVTTYLNTCNNNANDGILLQAGDAEITSTADQANSNGNNGMSVSVTNDVISGSSIDSFVARYNANDGISVTAGWVIEGLTVSNGDAALNGAIGILLNGFIDIHASIVNNNVTLNPTGIMISDALGDIYVDVTGNFADACNNNGIMISATNGGIWGNISLNEANGILAPAGNGIAMIAPNGAIYASVYANNVTYSGGIGILVQSSSGWIYSEITQNNASNATLIGIFMVGYDNEAIVSGNIANGCGIAGIASVADYTGISVTDNSASDCVQVGIAVIGNYGVYADVSGNTVNNCLGWGIYITNNLPFYTNVLTISDNHASYNNFNLFGLSAGIFVDFSSAGGNNYLTADFSGNDVHNNTIGIWILNPGIGNCGLTFTGDTAVNNTLDGIAVQTFDVQVSMFLCTADGNGMNGVMVNATNLLMCTLDSNEFNLNGQSGAFIEGAWSITATIMQNDVLANGMHGLRLLSDFGTISAMFEMNYVDGNLGNGIDVAAGTDILASFLDNTVTNNMLDGVHLNAVGVVSLTMDGDVVDYNGLDGIDVYAGSSIIADMYDLEVYDNVDAGIRLNAPAINALVDTSDIEYNDESIYMYAQNSLIADISGCYIYGNGYGAQLLCVSGDITATVTDSGIYYNGVYGVYTWQNSGNTYADFSSNDIYGNYGDGVRMSSNDLINVSFTSNSIGSNDLNGVIIGCWDLNTGLFVSNDIYDNGLNGIYVNTVFGTLVLSGNDIYNNCWNGGEAGVYLTGFVVTLRADAMPNWITGNYADGLQVFAGAQADIYMRAASGNYLGYNSENGLNAYTSGGWVDLYAENLYCYGNGNDGVLLGGPYNYVEVSYSDFSDNGNGFVMMPSNWCYGVIEDSTVLYNWNQVGIYAQYADGLSIRDCTVMYNPIGIDIEMSWSVYIYDNIVSENLDTGVLLDDVSDAQLWDNVVDDNLAYGVYIEALTNAVLWDNFIDRNLDTGLYVESGCNVDLFNNWVTFNYIWGVYCEVGSSVDWTADVSINGTYAYVKMNNVLLTGNVTADADSMFWLDDSTLWFNSNRVMKYEVTVMPTGLLNMDDSKISSWNDYTYGFYVWGMLDMDFGTIDEAYEVQVMSGGLVDALYSTIEYGFVHGIRAEPGSTVLCVETEFYENEHSGIYAEGATVDVSECLFNYNGREGIFATDCDLSVSWSIFESNDRGIRLDACTGVLVDSSRFQNNVVGLESLNASSVDVMQSWFQDNGIGTVAGGSSSEYFENCTMSGNYLLDIRTMGDSDVLTLNTPTGRFFDVRDTSALTVEWYLDVMVMDELMVPISGALVTVTDGNGVPIVSGVPTNSLGEVCWIIVTERIVYFAWTDLSMQPYVISATDGAAYAEETTVIDDTMTVYLVINHPPEYVPGSMTDVYFDEDSSVSDVFNLNDCFTDRDDITFSVSGNSMISVTINPNGSVDFASLVSDWAGSESVTFRATDEHGAFAEHTILVTVLNVNDPPEITSTPVTTGTQGVTYYYLVTATDADIVYGDYLTFSLDAAPAGMSINSVTGLIDWTPASDQIGLYWVVVEVDDSMGGYAMQMFSIDVANVNDAPTITSSPIISATQDAAYEYDVTADDVDIPYGDFVTFSLTTAPSGMVIDSATGVITWTPAYDQIGLNAVVVKVTDSFGLSATQSFSVDVANVNDPPMITSTPITSGTQGVDYFYVVTAIDADMAYGDMLTFSLDMAPAGMTIDPVTGVISWTPANDQIGVNWVLVRVSDISGAYDLQMFAVTVANVNDPPMITSTPVTTASQGALYEYDVTATDADIPYGDFLTFSLTTAPSGMTIDSATGVISWTPGYDQIGSNLVVVKVTDSFGSSSTQSFTVDVANVNDQPMITSTPVTSAKEGSIYYCQVTASDRDTPYGDTLTFSLDAAPAGMTIDPATGVISWTPAFNQVGTQLVTVRVTDSASAFATQTFTVMVENTPNAPVINAISPKTATVDHLFTFDVNATDADIPYGDVLIFSLTTAPSGMTIDSATGVIQWIPDMHSAPVLLVTVKVTDSAGLIDTETFAITVLGLNHPPSISSVSIAPVSPVRGSTLNATPAGYSDAESDTAQYVYQWYVNGVPVVGGNAVNISGVFSKGDIVACQVTPYDGKEYGAPVMSTGVVIGNTVPTMQGVSISPIKPMVSGTLTAVPHGYADIDGDMGTYLYQWEKYNATSAQWEPIVGATSSDLSGAFSEGDRVRCIATPFDGEGNGTPVTSEPVTITADPAPAFPVALLATMMGILFAAIFFIGMILWMMGRIKKKAAGADVEPEPSESGSDATPIRKLKTPPQT